MSTFKIVVAEDDEWYANFLSYNLGLIKEYEVHIAHSGKELEQLFSLAPNVITLDYGFPDTDGMGLLKKIKRKLPDTEVIVISGQEDVGVAVELLREGAYDYLTKNVETKERLWNTISKVRGQHVLKEEIQELRREVHDKYRFEKSLIGNSVAFKRIFPLLEKAAKSAINVSITGETGTGKEVTAKAIHYNSDRRKKKFVAVNLAAIPETLIESELFGHEKGAFTGAFGRRIGRFEEASGGTLFLDEIGELSLPVQVKLLRVLQEREIQRLGSNKSIPIDCRIICATHKNLNEEVQHGNFRQDLYYRIVGLPIKIPALREREGDIIILAKHFMKLAGRGDIHLSEKACERLLMYSYPGNIRELKSVVELACVLCDGEEICETHITFSGGTTINSVVMEDLTLKEMNQRIILHCLNEMDNDIPSVSKRLNIGKSTIYRVLKELK